MQNDPITSPMIDDDVQMFAWFAPDKQFLVYPVDYGKLFNFTCTHPEALSDKHTIEDDSVTAVGELQWFLIYITSLNLTQINSLQPKSLRRNGRRHLPRF